MPASRSPVISIAHLGIVPKWLCVLCMLIVSGCSAAGMEVAAGGEATLPITWDAPMAGAGARAPVELALGKLLAVRTVTEGETVRMVAAVSADGGRAWGEVDVVATDVRGTDLGDCHVTRLRDGRVWCSYRRNRVRGAGADGGAGGGGPTYAIEVAESADEGRTWRRHSVVAESRPASGRTPSRGLWSSFILERRDGTLQCYYDDEETPYHAGFPLHQWLSMRTWNARRAAWEDPVVVSRAHDPRHLSRDGMPSVVELVDGRLLAVFESVQTRRPHANVVRFVTSDDGGRTWSWSQAERGVVYEPRRRGEYMALAPWVVGLRDGTLVCVFCTDEDRDRADVSGTPPRRMNLDVKYVSSRDGGRTWSRPARLAYAGTHRNYLPGLIELASPPPPPPPPRPPPRLPRAGERGELLLQLLDFDRGYVLLRGHTMGDAAAR